MDIGVIPAFVAGFISFVSPCVLPLVPAYIGYLGGTAVTTAGTTQRNNYVTFLHAVFFVLGFTSIFVLLGATASAVGQLLNQEVYTIQKIGGVIVILFGLHMMGLFTAIERAIQARPTWRDSVVGQVALPALKWFNSLLYTEKRVHVQANPTLGFFSSFLVGIFFAAGWTPCVGPILGTILLAASSAESVGRGTVVLTAYSLGLGIPFLLTGLLLESMTGVLRRARPYLGVISFISGLFLIYVGFLLFTHQLGVLGARLQELLPWLTEFSTRNG
ncbi:cytochrome c biogenesis CcdA family protein [Candidatus Amarolinea aalborgensis]|jgi:cytochrome c-type biogenesis protein|uniref:cytochrome c biogenesis CcdA family protein n=1 Tax=Candidatus Amarolinea aalborgensis TaxID=2249329 RepID=UPI003BFA166D